MVNNKQIPTEKDWGELLAEDLDLYAAYEDFFGKSNAEMQADFSRRVIDMADSLRWMPAKPFQYYILGFADFVMSGKFHETDAADVASTYILLVEEKLQEKPRVLMPLMDKLFTVVDHLAKNQSDYGADEDIYGDFSKISEKIQKLWEAQK